MRVSTAVAGRKVMEEDDQRTRPSSSFDSACRRARISDAWSFVIHAIVNACSQGFMSGTARRGVGGNATHRAVNAETTFVGGRAEERETASSGGR